MPVTHQGVFVQTPEIAFVTATHLSSTNKVTIFTSATSGQGTKIVAISATSTLTTSNRTCQLFIAGNLVASTTIASNAGNSGSVAPANLLSIWSALPVDNDGQRYVFLKPGNTLQAAVTVAITTSKSITLAAIGADF